MVLLSEWIRSILYTSVIVDRATDKTKLLPCVQSARATPADVHPPTNKISEYNE